MQNSIRMVSVRRPDTLPPPLVRLREEILNNRDVKNQVAKFVGVDESTVRRWIRKGGISQDHLNKVILFLIQLKRQTRDFSVCSDCPIALEREMDRQLRELN
jgi:hypothetical protein